MAPPLELFPFRYRDPRAGKWVRARYVAELHEIKARYAEFELLGPPEVRDVNPEARYFAPHQCNISNLGPVLKSVGLKPARRVTVVGVAT